MIKALIFDIDGEALAGAKPERLKDAEIGVTPNLYTRCEAFEGAAIVLPDLGVFELPAAGVALASAPGPSGDGGGDNLRGPIAIRPELRQS